MGDIYIGANGWTLQTSTSIDDNLGANGSDFNPSKDNWHYAMSDSWTKTNCTQDEHNGGFEALAMAFGIAIFLTNFVVVAAIQRGGRKLHKATFYCICNLAVADMLAGLLLLWVFGLQRVVLPFRTAKSELVQKSVWTLTVWSSIMSQVVIAVDRYSHVTRGSSGNGSFPRGCDEWGSKQRRRMVIIGIASTWLIPTLTYVIPVMTFWNCSSNCSCYVKDNRTEVIYMTCLPTTDCSQVNPPFTKTNMLFLSLILLLLPLIPVVLYMKIFFFVRNSSKNLCPPTTKVGNHIVSGSYTENGWHSKRGTDDSHGNFSKEDSSGSKAEPFLAPEARGVTNNTAANTRKGWKNVVVNPRPHNSGNSSCEINCSHDHEKKLKTKTAAKSVSTNNRLRKRNQKRDMRLLRTLVIILALFVVSTVPLGILFVVSLTETDKRYVQPAKYLLTLSLLNSLINPWVYFWRFKEMRESIKRLFCSACLNEKKTSRRRDSDTCVCCHIPQPRKLNVFSSQHSARKATSSSSSSAF